MWCLGAITYKMQFKLNSRPRPHEIKLFFKMLKSHPESNSESGFWQIKTRVKP